MPLCILFFMHTAVFALDLSRIPMSKNIEDRRNERRSAYSLDSESERLFKLGELAKEEKLFFSRIPLLRCDPVRKNKRLFIALSDKLLGLQKAYDASSAVSYAEIKENHSDFNAIRNQLISGITVSFGYENTARLIWGGTCYQLVQETLRDLKSLEATAQELVIVILSKKGLGSSDQNPSEEQKADTQP